MTGLEMLKQEMLKRGCTKAQTESKLIAVVLDIVAETGTAYTDLREAEQRVQEIEDEAAVRRQWEKYTEADNKFREGVKQYVEDFMAMLRRCETPEARDALRAAQIFTNTVTVKDSRENAAYIAGLANILCGHDFRGTMGLKKVEARDPYISARY